jgi:hypothetical protein
MVFAPTPTALDDNVSVCVFKNPTTGEDEYHLVPYETSVKPFYYNPGDDPNVSYMPEPDYGPLLALGFSAFGGWVAFTHGGLHGLGAFAAEEVFSEATGIPVSPGGIDNAGKRIVGHYTPTPNPPDSPTFNPPEVAPATSPRITFGHGARHLEGSGLSHAVVESAIEGAVRATPSAGTHWGWVQVNGQWIQYRAYVLPDGTINIGTYVRVPGNLSNARVPHEH